MTEEHFLSEHSETWHKLETSCERIKKYGIKTFTTSEIKDFLNLFKTVSHHLAYAKTHYSGSQTITYLNNLVSQSNTYVYTSPKPNIISDLSSLFSSYSSQLKKYRKYILLAFGIFMAGTLLSFLMVLINPGTAPLFLDQSTIEYYSGPHSTEGGTLFSASFYPVLSSTIMVNNIMVAIKAFVYGILLGLGTIYILFYNGLMLGSLTAMVYLYDRPVRFWALILPHGVIELSAIFIAGAAGLLIAKSFLIPGKFSRKHSIIKGSKEALGLMSGVVVMLIIAALIEGFFTPLNIPEIIKLLFALLTAALLALYILTAYKKPSKASDSR